MSLIKKTLKERTREYILKLVQEQKLSPGDKLPAQREIAQTLNVSQKIPEIVLSELEAEHLVIRCNGRGTFLADPLYRQAEDTVAGRNIFLLLPTLRNPHFAEYAANAEIALLRHRKTLQIITAEAMPNSRDIIAKMVQEGTSGIIACYCPPAVRNFAYRHSVPIVQFRHRQQVGRPPLKEKCVISDLRSAALLLGNHILGLGHRDIYLAGDLPGEKIDFRFEVLMELLQTAGCRVRYLPQKKPVSEYSSYEAIGAELAAAMLAEGLPATAGIFFNTSRAVGAMRFLRQNGVRIPEDFSIAGFDKSNQNGFPEPIITVATHKNEIEMAVSMLLSEKKEIRTVKIDPVLVIGNSTGPVEQRKFRNKF